MSLAGRVALYGKDVFSIVRSPYPWPRKARLLMGLAALAVGFRGGNLLGYHVTHYNGKTLFFLYREIFARQCYLFRADTPKPLILDCGANIGMAVLYFKWLYPDSDIWAFEPEPRAFHALQENVTRNGLADVTLHNIALWDNDGHLDVFVPGNQPASVVTSANPARRGGTPLRVPCARLSSFIDRDVDFLKIDVEGAELRVIRDLAEQGKLGRIRQMVIEYHHNIPSEPSAMSSLLLLLEEAGFTYQIAGSPYPLVGRAHFQDVLIGAFQASRR